MTMFAAVLRTQWRWSAWAVVITMLVGFALPIVSVQDAGLLEPDTLDVVRMLTTVRQIGYLYPILALGAGVTMALLIWAPDHYARHVYALTLPVPRWRYVLLRLGAGAVLLVPAALAVWIGALVAAAASHLPEGLHAYAGALGLRFGAALLLGYSVFFALAAGTMRTTGIVLGILPVGLLGLNGLVVGFGGPNALAAVMTWASTIPGPSHLLFDPWLLINV